MATAEFTSRSDVPGNLWLWMGVLAPPLAWCAHLQVVYALAQAVCLDQLSMTTLHVVSAAALAAAVLGGLASCWHWSSLWPARSSSSDLALQRANFVALLGALAGIMFSLVIVAQWIAVAMLHPCPHYEGSTSSLLPSVA
jgi:hypothetical protein